MSSRNPFAPLLLLLLLLAFALPARAGDVCVDTVAELVSAIHAFPNQPDGSTHSIKIVKGTYVVGNQLGGITYSWPEAVGLSIKGGYNPGCSTRDLNPAFTVIDGNDQTNSAIQLGLTGDVNAYVDGLTFTRLMGDGYNAAFSLTLNNSSSEQARYTIQRCRFIHNSSNRIVGMSAPQIRFINNVVANNQTYGNTPSAVRLYFAYGANSGAIATNNTITANSGSGLSIRSDTAGQGQTTSRHSEVTNNILWANGLDLNLTHFDPIQNAITVEGNVIGGYSGSTTLGATNLSSDPYFVNVAAENYALQGVSPAINSGFMFQWFGFPGVDLVGNERVIGTHIDRGAFESSLDDRVAFVVTNVGDNGDNQNPLPGSLRAGIKAANAATVPFRISFEISGGCPRIINMMTTMLDVRGDVTIDARTQPGWSPNTAYGRSDANLCIVLNGAGATTHAFRIPAAAGSIARLSVFGLVFAGFTDTAIRIEKGHNHRIAGNQFGAVPFTAANGSAVRVTGASGGAFIGGYDDPETLNLIAGSTGVGVHLDNTSGGNTVANNLIGFQADGNSAGGNSTGIFVYNSPNNTLQYNFIGYSASTGITLSGPSSHGNLIQYNGIGLDSFGNSPGNSGAGVAIVYGAHYNIVGAPLSGNYGANFITGNTGSGVWISPNGGDGNQVLYNIFFDNGAIDIDLGAAGPTANQPTNPASGPNRLQNYPTLTLAERTSGANPTLTLGGQLHSAPNSSYRIDFYLGDCDPTAPSRGTARYWIGRIETTTAASGDASFSNVFNFYVSNTIPSSRVSATATSSSGDTSEIGECFAITDVALPDALFQDGFD